MKVLVIGGGGREHAIVWKIRQSKRVKKIFCAPGNPGIAELAECVSIGVEDISGLAEFAQREKIDLVVIGPEMPLAIGVADELESLGFLVFGPSKRAAELEGSKVFAKEVMNKFNIPTAWAEVFTDPKNAMDFINQKGVPLVIKADGLAAGKGVTIAEDLAAAEEAVRLAMKEKIFGEAGTRVIIEEKLEGEEASILAFSDGETVKLMVSSQDHKRVFDGDRGSNTGGMGAYSPAPVMTDALLEQSLHGVLLPVVRGMKKLDRPYRGVIYAGMMVTANGPKVLEFNARFGDPETQVILPRLETDLVDIMEAVIQGKLSEIELKWSPKPAVCVCLCSGGYPGNYAKGKIIRGLSEVGKAEDVLVFHAGTALSDGKIVTSGGRVLGITALAEDIGSAIDRAYTAVKIVDFEGMHFRSDIGSRAVKRGQT